MFIRHLITSSILLALSGCSTFATIAAGSNREKFDCDEKYTIPRVYSGVFNDIRFLRGNYPDQDVVVLDFPFSLVADTIVLPYTAYTQAAYGNLCEKKN
ncbi:MAG: YceK/YidQ family lipoprotein [Gammaproteobacteria bacterium]|nr:YceK/YidQ family lipoprotein [Gammaproteobacteria bacterium]